MGSLSGSIVGSALNHLAVGTDQSGSVVVSGTLTNMSIGGGLTSSGSITAGTLGTLSMVGNQSGTVSASGTLTNLTIGSGSDLTNSGSITAATLAGALSIGANLNGDLYVTTKIDSGSVTVTGAMAVAPGDYPVIDIASLEGSTLTVGGAVGKTANITIGNMISDGGGTPSGLTFSSEQAPADFAGDLVLQNGLPAAQTVTAWSTLTSSGSVAFTSDPIAGVFTLHGGGGGDLIGGGEVTSDGEVWLADNGFTYSGTATCASIAAGGQVIVGSTFNSPAGKLKGHINCGNVAGVIKAGYLLVYLDPSTFPAIEIPGTINVGSLTGAGGILVTNECEGDILVTGSISQGSGIEIGGSLAGSAEIEVRGMCDGFINIGKDTATDTLIRLLGIDDNGRVLINEGKQNFNANGTIRVAPFLYPVPPPLPNVTFDGWIKIREGIGGVGGDLKGPLTVFGCHASWRTLDICLCGGGGAQNVDIEQDGCWPEVAWDCLGVCP